MILIIGSMDFVSNDVRNAAVAAAGDLQQDTRDNEAGCVAYSFSADSSIDVRVQVHEIWADEGSLAAHFRHPNFAAMKGVLARFERVGTSNVAKYRCDLSEPIYDADRRPRADFFTAPK
jgi:quinol monooxygenase YgiN